MTAGFPGQINRDQNKPDHSGSQDHQYLLLDRPFMSKIHLTFHKKNASVRPCCFAYRLLLKSNIFSRNICFQLVN